MQTSHRHHPLFPHYAPPPNIHPGSATFTLHPRLLLRPLTALSPSKTNPISNLPENDAAIHDYQLLFTSQPAESASPLPLSAIEGILPADFPLGTYYLIGPGMITDHHGSTVSPLDGHGYLRAFHFRGGSRVMYSARYVETEAAREERVEDTGEWRFLRPGHFSMLSAGLLVTGPRRPKNVANTTVLSWGGRLFCLWEGGHPYEIEPSSLATLGPADLIGAAKERPWRRGRGGGQFTAGITKDLLHIILGMPPKRTLSHYKIDARRKRLLVLSCDTEDMFLPNSTFTFSEFDDEFELKQKNEFVISDQLMIHDWAFTDSHYILTGNRIKFDMPGALLAMTGLAPMISTVSLNPSQPTTPIYLLPRFSDSTKPKRDWRIPVEAPSQLWTSHVGNAFEERDDSGNLEFKIYASVCSYQWFNFQKMFGYDWQSKKLDPSFMNVGNQGMPYMVQISIRLDADGRCQGCAVANSSSQWNKSADFPIINPIESGQSNRFIYASSTSGSSKLLPHFPFDSVIKLDCSNGMVKSWRPGSRRFVGEPMFISKRTADEEDGYIMVVEYAVSKERCYLAVLDAKRIGDDDAVIAKLEVPEHLRFPLGFHGVWDGK